MKLFLLRHGPAWQRGDPRWPDDDLRPLDPAGRRKLKAIAAGMKAMGWTFGGWWTSPLVRARQTAEIVAAAFGAEKTIEVVPELAPGGDFRKLLRRLRAAPGRPDRVVLVGHEPYLGDLLGLLVSGRTDLSLGLKKGGLARVTFEGAVRPGAARLDWLLTPRQLARLG